MSSNTPTDNRERCGHCGTLNPVGQDRCIQCDQPLTASADSAIEANLEAEDDAAVMGGHNEITTFGAGLTAADVDYDAARRDTKLPIVPERPA